MFSRIFNIIKATQKRNLVADYVIVCTLWLTTITIWKKARNNNNNNDRHAYLVRLFRVMCLLHAIILIAFCAWYYGLSYYWSFYGDYSLCYPDNTTSLRFKRYMQKQAINYTFLVQESMVLVFILLESVLLIMEWCPTTSPSFCNCSASKSGVREAKLFCSYFHRSRCFDSFLDGRYFICLLLCISIIIPSLLLVPFAAHDRRSCMEHVQMVELLFFCLGYVFWVAFVMDPLSSNLYTLQCTILDREFCNIISVN